MAYLQMLRKRKADINELLLSDSEDNQVTDTSNELNLPDDVGHSTSDTSDSDFHTDIGMSNSDSEVEIINELMHILKQHGHVLPKDARTLQDTPQTVDSQLKRDGQYIYYGLERGISRVLMQDAFFRQKHDTVHLDVNVDGLPLFKSSKLQFWPMLVKYSNCIPFIVALYCGKSKPEPLEDYLKDFLEELKDLRDNGLMCNGKKFGVNLHTFVCDAPARAYLKYIKGHTAYGSCERCLVRGQYVERRVVFNQLSSTLRTVVAFSRVEYSSHQTRASPLIAAGIPCVSAFVLDYMHTVCLGVVRRMLVYLTGGPKFVDCLLDRNVTSQTNLKYSKARCPESLCDSPVDLMS